MVFMIFLLHQNCYLNPIFREIFFEEGETNQEILSLVVAALGRSEASNLSSNDLDEESIPSDPAPVIPPSITIAPNSYSFTKNFSIQAIRPIVEGTPFSNCVSDPSLPENLLINPSNCRITGSVPNNSFFVEDTFSISATNALGTASDTVQIQFAPPTGNDEARNFYVSVSGLQPGESFIFDDILGNDIFVNSNGSVSYNHPHLVGSPYLFTIVINPPGRTCTIENPSGTVSMSNPTIQINCG